MDTKTTVIFTFVATRSQEILLTIPELDVVALQNDIAEIDRGLNDLLKRGAAQIIGVGDYSGRDTNQIRIETMARNKFRNEPIANNSVAELPLDTWLRAGQHSKFAAAMGNSLCNYAAYQLTKTIIDNQLQTSVSFFA